MNIGGDVSFLWREGGSLKPANLISLSRLIAVVPIAALVVAQHANAALCLYLVAVATDGMDGWLARRQGRASVFGAVLDAVVDNIFSVAIALFLWLAMPVEVTANPVAFAALFGLPVIYLGVSWLMTGKVLMFHFTSARLGAFLLFSVWPVIQILGWSMILPLAALVVSASRIEQVIFILRGGRDQDARHGGAKIGCAPSDRRTRPVMSATERSSRSVNKHD